MKKILLFLLLLSGVSQAQIVGGYLTSTTGVPVTRNLTINGVTFNLSADRTWSISAVPYSGAVADVTLATRSLLFGSTSTSSGYVQFTKTGFNTISGTTGAGLRIGAGTSGEFAWVTQNSGNTDGFTRRINGTLTGHRDYTMPDASGTIALTSNISTSLAAYVPYSGATNNLNLGSYGISATTPTWSGVVTQNSTAATSTVNGSHWYSGSTTDGYYFYSNDATNNGNILSLANASHTFAVYMANAGSVPVQFGSTDAARVGIMYNNTPVITIGSASMVVTGSESVSTTFTAGGASVLTGGVTTPTVYGSSASGGILNLMSTSNATKGTIQIGASTGTTVLNSGYTSMTGSINIGNASVNTTSMGIARIGQGNTWMDAGQHSAGNFGLWFGVTPTSSNYSFLGDGTNSIFNSPSGGSLNFRVANTTYATLSSTAFSVAISSTLSTGTNNTAAMTALGTGTATTGNGIAIRTNNTTAGSRDFAIMQNDNAFGDLQIRQSASQGSDPFTGTRRFSIGQNGCIGINTAAPTRTLDLTGTSNLSSTVNIGQATFPTGTGSILRAAATSTNWIDFGEYGAGGASAIWGNQSTLNGNTFALAFTSSQTFVNATTQVKFQANGNDVGNFTRYQWELTPTDLGSGSTRYFGLTPANRTGITTGAEHNTLKSTGITKTWAGTTTVTNQRDHYFSANTYASSGGNTTVTKPYGLYVEKAIAGTSVTISTNVGIGTDGIVEGLLFRGTTYGNLITDQAGTGMFSSNAISNGGLGLASNGTQGIAFYKSGTGGTEVARFSPTNYNLLLNTTTDDGTNNLQVSGSAKFTGGLSLLSTGGAPVVGTVTLVGGSATVSTTKAVTGAYIFFQRKTSGGTIGTSTTYTVSNGTSFTVTSDNVLDTSTFNWWIINP